MEENDNSKLNKSDISADTSINNKINNNEINNNEINNDEINNNKKNNNKINNNKMNSSNSSKATTNKSVRRKIVVIVSIIAAIIAYISIRGSYLEMQEVGKEYLMVFWRNTAYTSLTFIANFIFVFLSFYLINKTMRKGLKVFFDEEKKEVPRFPNKSVSFIIALIVSTISTPMMIKKMLLCFSGSKFGIKDPVFNLDVSLMVFAKPFVEFILIYIIVIILATLAYAILYSIIILNKSFNGISRETITKCDLPGRIASRVKLLSVLAGLFVVVFMIMGIGNEKFMGIRLSDGTNFSIYGAGTADVRVKVIGYAILAILTTFSIQKIFKAIKERSIRRAVGSIFIVPVYLIILAVVLSLYQIIFIGKETLASNQNYIKENINYTKQAYNIQIGENIIDDTGTLTSEQISKNSNLLNNIGIVSSENVIQDLQNVQNSKGYYSYRNTQIEKYNINNKPTLVYVTPREIESQNSTYYSKTYQYTHGYGAIITLAGSTDDSGYLKSYNKEIKNAISEPIKISQPQIYYGLETNNSAVINGGEDEIDYIDEDTNEENKDTYKGNAGLKLDFIDRIILAMKEKDAQLAFSGSVTENSKILTNRNILNRAKSVMPYLKYDSSPYLVIDDNGKQYWVLDAYTYSNYYPFSQKSNLSDLEEINYIRNSVKVIINAYDGTMRFYITDRNDPIVMAYNKLYPTLFQDAEEKIPDDISKHFVYPKMLFNLQAEIINVYHNIKPEVLYRGNDIWQIAETTVTGKEEYIKPYYSMVKNKNGEEELGIIIPYSNYKKQNLIAYLTGIYENGNEKLILKRFSSDSNVMGPAQLETQINQDETISQEIASLNTTGAKITKNMQVIPVDNTVLYVETIYQQLINETSQKPMLKRVVVASGDKIAIGNNLNSALQNLLSKYAVNIEVKDNENKNDLINGIIKANQNVKNSSKSSDWTLFGEDMQRLTTLIDQLQNTIENEEKANQVTNNNVAQNVTQNATQNDMQNETQNETKNDVKN